MLTLRRAEERGRANLGWLDSRHSFSFGHYYDPEHMGFGPLRVINDDRVAPGGGFPTHPHGDMEIVTYVLDGALAHKDSLGTGAVIRAGDVQRMSAGSGIRHSEFNASKTEPVHFLQIWIEPSTEDLRPSYQQLAYDPGEKRGALRLMSGPDASAGAAVIRQDARMYASVLAAGESIRHALAPGRHAWVQCVSGEIDVSGLALKAGDGVAISEEDAIDLRGGGEPHGELLLFDLA
jgi:hypothetical protein